MPTVSPVLDCIIREQRIKAKPLLKWAGGKTQLLEQIENRLPKELLEGKIKRYTEPFIGGGALYFYLASRYQFDECTLMDNNPDLIMLYKTVKTQTDELIKKLFHLELDYRMANEEDRKRMFYLVREKFNEEKKQLNYNNLNDSCIIHTAHFIFLNKTAFNGLYRVNTKGEFNVPFGGYKNPTICNEDNLKKCAELLQNTNLICSDFSLCLEYADINSFVYFDPPYRPINSTSSFNQYSKGSFNDDEQKRLADIYKKLNYSGIKAMLSNSDPKNHDLSDNFFDELYSEFNIQRVNAKRMINCDATKRNEITEVLITNY